MPRNDRNGSFERQPTSVADAITHDPMFGRTAEGMLIERERACECGRRFTQHILSERFMRIVEQQSKHAAELVTKQVPGLWIPVHCLSCERRDLGHQATIDESRRLSAANAHVDALPFGDREAEHAAD